MVRNVINVNALVIEYDLSFQPFSLHVITTPKVVCSITVQFLNWQTHKGAIKGTNFGPCAKLVEI